MIPAIIGAVGGLIGQKIMANRQPDPGWQMQAQSNVSLEHEKRSFDQKMALAKEHGLHPLSVLGVPMATFAPSISSGGGGDYSDIGAHAANIYKAATVKPPETPAEPEPDSLQRRLIDAQVRQAEAQAKKTEWEALGTEWRTQDLLRGQPGNPPGVRTSNDSTVITGLAAAQAGVSPRMMGGSGVKLEQTIDPPHPSIVGHSLGAGQSFQRVVDSTGELISIPNPNIYNPDIEQFGTFHTLAQQYGVDRAMKIMAALENAPLVGGILGGAGYAGVKAYQYFAKQRADALRRRTTRQSWGKPGMSRSISPRNE